MKQGYLWIVGAFIMSASVLSQACPTQEEVYHWADKRQAEHEVFNKALECEEATPESLENAIISLGRVGGEVAVEKITPFLSHTSEKVRKASAFALGIAKAPAAGDQLIAALESEENAEVQYRLALALGNTGNIKAQKVLTQIVNEAESLQKVRGALQGLVLLSAFHKNIFIQEPKEFASLSVKRILSFLKTEETQLEASYLLARIPLLSDDKSELISVAKMLAPSIPDVEANLIKALTAVKSRDVVSTVLAYVSHHNFGAQINAIRGLPNIDEPKLPAIGAGQVMMFENPFRQVTALQAVRRMQKEELLGDWYLRNKIFDALTDNSNRANSWVQSEALITLAKHDEYRSHEVVRNTAKAWLSSNNPNLQRAAIQYYVELNDKETLQKLSKSDKQIIVNGAKQALEPTEEKTKPPSSTPKTVPELPQLVTLKTTKGDITIKLFADTPYTSANFIRLIKEGFYDNTYFHRVVPYFVAQGGSKAGDGSGNVDYSIREELSYRSHLPGTVGMATLGKDTGGAQFFINTAPNLHLDSNYTIFGEVVDGMGVAIKLEQNDRVLRANLVDN